jgi:O-6-methylguanine DNA methyltransferase
MASESLYRSVISTPLGLMTLVVSPRGVREIHFGDVPGPAGAKTSQAKTAALARQLGEYFAGKRRDFDLALDPQGTAFQQNVWRALLSIPYGATASYKQVARAVGKPKACRAVGGANRRNPLPIVVPCHRVIGSSGALVGYSGTTGLPKKVFLLDLEHSARA